MLPDHPLLFESPFTFSGSAPSYLDQEIQGAAELANRRDQLKWRIQGALRHAQDTKGDRLALRLPPI